MIEPFESSRSSETPKSLSVVLLEDGELLGELALAPQLRQFGFEVNSIDCVTELRMAIKRKMPDIVLLDIGLPDSSGFDAARLLRVELPKAGIVLLAERSENIYQVRGLSEGADAYLAKPVDIDVLIATLHSVARRLKPLPASALSHNKWYFSPDGWLLVSPDGVRVSLTKTERRLLGILTRYPGQAVSRDALIDAFSHEAEDFSPQRVDSVVHRLRKKVLVAAGERLPLESVHGTGYILSIS